MHPLKTRFEYHDAEIASMCWIGNDLQLACELIPHFNSDASLERVDRNRYAVYLSGGEVEIEARSLMEC